MAFEPTDEYLAILRDAREQIVYLNELGVQGLDSGNVVRDRPATRKISKPTSATVHIASSIETEASPETAKSRTVSAPSPAASLLFEDSLLPPPKLQKSSESFEQIHDEIGNCTRCPLFEKRTHIVHTEGNRKARLMFVGEAPGADEDIKARPFVGRAGQLLTKIIEAIGFKRDEVLIGNVNRCRPPGNRPPTEQEASTCKPFLLREIAAVQPDVIVVLGNTATRNLLETKMGITRLRGEFQDYQGVKVMPTFHPAYLLRDPSKKQETWQDLKKVRDYLEATRKRAT